MNEFKTYHPIVNFIYFVCVIGFSIFFMHPICLMISLVCGFTYSAFLKGKKSVRTSMLYILPILIVAAVINPAFNHEGVTILTYLPSGNPLTMESIVYGLAAAVMLVSVICWFSCYNAVMTSDKFIYLFGRIIPSLSLVLSMTLRFVPKFTEQLREVSCAQKCIGRDVSNGSVINRAKHGLCILSVMMTWALESSVETADSMRARGYGLSGRTAFSVFTFDGRDKISLLCIILLSGYILAGGIAGGIYFRYFPSMKWTGLNIWEISIFTAYLALCAVPIVIELWEVKKWTAIKSKM